MARCSIFLSSILQTELSRTSAAFLPMARSQPQPELSLREFVEHLAAQHGVDLRGYKVSTLERRIHKRMHELNMHGYRAYQKVLQGDPSEAVKLLNTVLINVTEFFRDPAAWEYLR